MSTINIVMAAKKPKTIKKVTEIDEAKVTIEVEATEDEVKESVKSTELEEEEKEKETDKSADAASASNADDSDKETPEVEEPEIEEEKEPVIENFDNENSWFSWSKVLLFIVIAAITGFIIVGVYLFFIEGYDFSLTKDSEKKTVEIEEELSPTQTPETIDRSAFDIQVLNGSGIAGEAANVQTLLEDEDFSVSEIGNAESADFTRTQILYTEDVSEEFLDELESVLETRGPVETEEADADQTEDVVVIVGSDLAEEETTPTPELE